jgi:predicted TIM-barrel fold metal-dependent hydrolase
VWGSDYPFITPERCLSELGDLGLPCPVRDAVLCGNAARILGLPG